MQQKMCCRHPNYPISLINLSQQSAQLWCEECLLEKEEFDGTLKIRNIIQMNKALANSDYLLTRLNISNQNAAILKDFQQSQQHVLEQQIKDVEQSIEELKKYFLLILNDINDKMKRMILIRQKFQNELNNIIKFQEFKQIIQDINQQETNINPDAVQQIEQRLFQYFSSLQQNNSQNLNQQLSQFMYNFQLNIKKEIGQFLPQDILIQLIKNYQTKYSNIMRNMGQNCNCFGSELIENSFEQKLQLYIKERIKKENLEYQLIYKGSKDGLNAKAFWSKVQGRSNLLMVFKSQNNNVFGAYSPCQWNENLNSYVLDGTYSSFLISQTHNEFYPIKDNNRTIYCGFGYGPTFGSGHDIYINGNNFSDGYSNLGKSYQWDKFQNKQSNHLFGSDKPNLVELEIFQIMFK